MQNFKRANKLRWKRVGIETTNYLHVYRNIQLNSSTLCLVKDRMKAPINLLFFGAPSHSLFAFFYLTHEMIYKERRAAVSEYLFISWQCPVNIQGDLSFYPLKGSSNVSSCPKLSPMGKKKNSINHVVGLHRLRVAGWLVLAWRQELSPDMDNNNWAHKINSPLTMKRLKVAFSWHHHFLEQATPFAR